MAEGTPYPTHPQGNSLKVGLSGIIAREARFFWNLVNPLHGRATVLISRDTGEVIGKQEKRRHPGSA